MAERRIILGKDPAIPANDYIISTIMANSSPLADKARLVQHPDDTEDDYQFMIDTSGNASFQVRILVEGTDADDTQVTIDNILAKVAALRSGEVKYEYDVGKERFALPAAFSDTFTAEATMRARGTGAILDIVFSADQNNNNLTTSPPSSAPSGAISELTWTIATNEEGYSSAIGEVVFKDRASANAWVNGLQPGGGSIPYWMGTSDEWKLMNNEVTTNDRPSGFTGDADHVVNVRMVQQVAEIVGIAAMEVFRDWGWSITKADREPNSGRGFSSRGGRKPGHNIVVVGQMTPKVGKIGLFNPGDSSVLDPTDLDDKITAGLDALVKQVNTRLPNKWREVTRQYEVDARDHEITFTLKGLMTDPLSIDDIKVNEVVTTHYQSDQRDVPISNASIRTFHSIVGMRITLDHVYTVVSFKRPRYKMPVVAGGRWESNAGNVPMPVVDTHQNGELIYTLDVATSWRRVPESPGDVVHAPTLGGTLSSKELQTG